jgi:hypothetical protein
MVDRIYLDRGPFTQATMSAQAEVHLSKHRLLGSYNGFTGLERARGARVIWWAVAVRLIAPPAFCSICGVSEPPLQYHSENYYDPLHPYPICRACHSRLHGRFRATSAWIQWIEKHAQPGSWFAALHLEPIDLASRLRTEHGDRVADIGATVLSQIPEGIILPPEALRRLWCGLGKSSDS